MAKMIGQKRLKCIARCRPIIRGAYLRLFFAGAVALLLSACLAKRDAYDVPSVPMAARFKNADALNAANALALAPKNNQDNSKFVTNDAQVGFEDWWRSFGNRELDDLVNRGLANNPDVRMATIRLAQAKARADQAKAGLLPSLSMPAVAARQAPGGTVGSVPVASLGRAAQNSFQGSLKGEWRLDIWGEQSSLAESANLQLWRAVYERDNVQRNIAANIVSSYVEYASFNDRMRLATETERVLSATLNTVERRMALGDATIGDFEQQKALVFGLRAAIPAIEQQREDSLNSLAFLVGSVPGALRLSDQGLDAFNVPVVIPGLPSSLLLRRPDVRMAEARLLAADADIDVARTRILPPVDLSAQAGYSSNLLAQFFQPKLFFWNAVASVTASIFDGGKREGEKKFSEAVHEEMVENYVRTIYQAMREVESALATIRLAGKRLDAQREAADSARRAWEINTKVYAMGGADQNTLLESERTFHRYLDEFRRSQMENYRGYTALFLALGGGVKHGEVLPGGGRRPAKDLSGKVITPIGPVVSPIKVSTVEGLDIEQGGFGFSGGSDQAFWQVELPGLYHRNTVGAAWRDLRVRYPLDMDRRMVRPRLNGRIDDSSEGQEAWYRLFIAKFDSIAQAQEFCDRMQANLERCRVVNAKGEETPRVELKQEKLALALPVEQSKEVSRVSGADGTPSSSLVIQESKPKAIQRESALGRQAQTIQLAAFSNLENAAISSAVWQFRGYEVYVAETRSGDGRLWYSVRTGIFPDQTDAANAAQQIRRKEEAPALLVPVMLDAAGLPASIDVSDVLTLKKEASNAAVLPEPPEAPLSSSSSMFVDGAQLKSSFPVRQATAKTKPVFAVQLGAFSSLENAEVSSKYWQDRGLSIYINQVKDGEGRAWFAVRTGNFVQRREASLLAVQLGRKENVSAIVVSVAVDVEKDEKIKLPVGPMPVSQTEATERAIPIKTNVAKSELPSVSSRPHYSIQLGVYGNIENAAKAFAEWQLRGYEPYVCDTGGLPEMPRFAVRTGSFSNKREAQVMVKTIERQEGRRGLVVPELIDSKGDLVRIDVTPLLKGDTSVTENVNSTNGR